MTKPRKTVPAKTAPTRITLSASRDIPLDQLVLAQTNVRRLKAGLSIEELAEDIARRTLLQSLSVRPILDEAGAETGRYEIPAGGRRFRALQLLVQQRRLFLGDLDADSRMALFAHCAALTLDAVQEPGSRRTRALADADRLAAALDLDLVVTVWSPTVDNYLGRVTKAQILDAVREGKGEAGAQLIDHLKKADMAREAERLLAGTGWLPEPLRGAGGAITVLTSASPSAEALPDFLTADGDAEAPADSDDPYAIAAE